ncbi:uncharacterized protein [Heptranchias perlo]|uniref:uncharacterized protein n=1 Tax=Heptranchias perlo TaxID=212740 RepID=UPI00355A0C77
MKFYHVRPKSSLKEQRVTVKDLIVTFFLIFLSERCRACDSHFRPLSTNYAERIEELRTHLPIDYSLSVLLHNAPSLQQDSCCMELQRMMSLNQSIGHLYRNSVPPLQNLTDQLLWELRFLKHCPVNKSFKCATVRWNSTHLLQNLKEQMSSFDNKHSQKECLFEQCTLHICMTGQIETMLSTVTHATMPSIEETATFTNVTNPSPTLTNPSPTLTTGNLTTLTNETNQSPTLTNRSQAALNNGTNASPTTLVNNSNGTMAATQGGSTDSAQTLPLTTGTGVFILVASILSNFILLGCLLKKNRRLTPPTMTEMESLSPSSVEVLEQ